jgi:hypothetical protein
MGNFLELERRDLVRNLRSFDDVLDAATALLADGDAPARWADRREQFMAETVNLTDVIVDVATDPESLGSVAGLSRRRTADRSGSADAEAGATRS